MSKSWQVGTHHPGGRAEPVTLPPPCATCCARLHSAMTAQCKHCTLQSPRLLYPVPPALAPSTLYPISPTYAPALSLIRPSTTPPILQLSDFPTSRKVEKPTNRKVGKLAPTTGRGSTTPPNAAKTSHLPPLRPLSFTLHHTCPFPSLLLPPGKPRRPVCARTHSTTRTVPAAASPH